MQKRLSLRFVRGLVAAIIVGFLITLTFRVSNIKADRVRCEFKEKIDSLETVINHMQGVDTLVFEILRLNTYNINKVSRNQTELSKRINIVQQKTYDLDSELDSYD